MFERFKESNNLVNGYRILKWAEIISRYHRSLANSDFLELIDSLIEKLKRQGFNGIINTPSYKIDGKTTFDSWVPVPWKLNYGRLEMVEPEKKLIIDSFARPISVLYRSRSTNGVEEYEVIDVGKGESVRDYEGKDISGKAVLATGETTKVYRLAVKKFGAVCILNCWMRAQEEMIGRKPELMGDVASYTGIPGEFDESKTKAFGFSLSYSEYFEIKRLLQSGKKVKISAFIDAKIESGEMRLLELILKGKNEKLKPIIVVAHLCHPSPGANDNATGSAVVLETAQVLDEVLKNGIADSLERSIVFLLVPEMFGTVAYMLEGRDFEVGINLDMVGEDQEKTGAVTILTQTPWSTPTFMNDLLDSALRYHMPYVHGFGSLLPTRRYIKNHYSGGSDHFVLNHFDVPTPFIGHWPDKYYHSSGDTLDKVDPEELEWIAKSVLSSILFLNDPSKDLLEIIFSNSVKDLMDIRSKYVKADLRNPEFIRNFLMNMFKIRFYSVKNFYESNDLDGYFNQFERFFIEVLPKREAKKEPLGLRYRKRQKSPIGNVFNALLDENETKKFENIYKNDRQFRQKLEETMNLMKKGYNIDEILDILDLQFSTTNYEDLKEVLEMLEKHGLIEKI
ncbi:MAG: DUF4910 domain-containing protein [Thermotogae bacterium]|nr:DUF4910 domain-containing protein [Thermotogota bacterium]